jgi:UDP-3-O-[3-hydroxymyristoyl] glucosamine N-acyltransferase
MPDRRFFRIDRKWRLGELAAAIGIAPPPAAQAELPVTGVASLASAGPGDLAYYADPRERAAFAASAAAAILTSPELAAAATAPPGAVLLHTPQPAGGFATAVQALYGASLREVTAASGEAVAADAELGENVVLAPGVAIGPGARIGAGSEIGANAVIGPGVELGPGTRIGPGASLRCCVAGADLVVSAGARIGEAGFGFRPDGTGGFVDFPHLGRVVIGDHVSVGANSCIDRGALDDTVIGDWCRIDNLVQIGHNVRMGRRCILAGMVGIAGSVTLGDDVRMGGQSGAGDHVSIGAGALIAGGAYVGRDVAPGADLSGVPGVPLRQKQRELVLLKRMVAGDRAKNAAGAGSGDETDKDQDQGDGQDG